MVQRSYYRAIWISDIHLGTRACKASALLDFLRHHIAETLYLVGDIVDGWNWGPSWHWSVEQQELVDEIRAMAPQRQRSIPAGQSRRGEGRPGRRTPRPYRFDDFADSHALLAARGCLSSMGISSMARLIRIVCCR